MRKHQTCKKPMSALWYQYLLYTQRMKYKGSVVPSRTVHQFNVAVWPAAKRAWEVWGCACARRVVSSVGIPSPAQHMFSFIVPFFLPMNRHVQKSIRIYINNILAHAALPFGLRYPKRTLNVIPIYSDALGLLPPDRRFELRMQIYRRLS